MVDLDRLVDICAPTPNISTAVARTASPLQTPGPYCKTLEGTSSPIKKRGNEQRDADSNELEAHLPARNLATEPFELNPCALNLP